jgi:putative transposase
VIERLWRSVKYLHAYETVLQLETGLGGYMQFSNHERPHQSLAYQTPMAVHFAASTCHGEA